MTIGPTTTYAAPAFSQASRHIKKLQILQNKTLRLMTGAPWYVTNEQLHNSLKIPKIDKYINKLTTNICEKMENHKNPTIQRITEYKINKAKLKKIKRLKHTIC